MASDTKKMPPVTPETEAKASQVLQEMENDPSFLAAVLTKIENNPTLRRLKDVNVKYSTYGAKVKLGELLCSRLQTNVVERMLPAQYHPALDFPLVRPGINLLAGNGLLVAGATFQDRVPTKYQPYMLIPGEAMIAHAWNSGFGSVDIEGFFESLFDGEIFGLCKKAAEEEIAGNK